MKFIGIDLGWTSGASGLCCLEWSNGCLHLLELDRQQATTDILNWVDKWTSPTQPAMIAVDAPTLIPNATGMRLPDKLTHQHFRHYHAGCYPANLGRPFAQHTIEFGLTLEARGFSHAPVIIPQTPGRYQIEVYPHPAIVHLFGLTRILKYKKGKLCDRHSELLKLHHYILTLLPTLTPSLTLPSPCPLRLCGSLLPTGIALKAIEDQLDSLICAYIAAHWWYWGIDRNWVLGDTTTGYIVIPAPTLNNSKLSDPPCGSACAIAMWQNDKRKEMINTSGNPSESNCPSTNERSPRSLSIHRHCRSGRNETGATAECD